MSAKTSSLSRYPETFLPRGQEEANKICQKLKLIGPFGAIESTKKLTGTGK